MNLQLLHKIQSVALFFILVFVFNIETTAQSNEPFLNYTIVTSLTTTHHLHVELFNRWMEQGHDQFQNAKVVTRVLPIIELCQCG